MVEAGTGVGKSFAYLVPAILAATASQVTDAKAAPRPAPGGDEKGEPKKEKRTRVVISTHTLGRWGIGISLSEETRTAYERAQMGIGVRQ